MKRGIVMRTKAGVMGMGGHDSVVSTQGGYFARRKPLYENIHIIAFTALLVRLAVVFLSDSIHQPDEVFQYLEQAHRLEFGYGIIPWEYRFGVRSWVLPGLIASALHLFHLLGLDDPHIYIPAIRIFFSFLSLSLVYAAAVIVGRFASERAAFIASWVVCIWYELAYFAGRAIPEVLSTYCLFSALALAVTRPAMASSLAIGFLYALAAIVRLQYLPAVLIVLSIAFIEQPKRERGAARVLLSSPEYPGLLSRPA